MNGRIIGISGPTVSVDLKGLRLYERVLVGRAGLMGEVVRVGAASRNGLWWRVENEADGYRAALNVVVSLPRPIHQIKNESRFARRITCG